MVPARDHRCAERERLAAHHRPAFQLKAPRTGWRPASSIQSVELPCGCDVQRHEHKDRCRLATYGRLTEARLARAEPTDIYFAGTECKDLSYSNTTSRKALDYTLNKNSGRSTVTLHASVAYALRFQLILLILDQVYRITAATFVLKSIREAGLYDVECYAVDNINFGSPNGRKRLAIIGVSLRRAHLLVPVNE